MKTIHPTRVAHTALIPIIFNSLRTCIGALYAKEGGCVEKSASDTKIIFKWKEKTAALVQEDGQMYLEHQDVRVPLGTSLASPKDVYRTANEFFMWCTENFIVSTAPFPLMCSSRTFRSVRSRGIPLYIVTRHGVEGTVGITRENACKKLEENLLYNNLEFFISSSSHSSYVFAMSRPQPDAFAFAVEIPEKAAEVFSKHLINTAKLVNIMKRSSESGHALTDLVQGGIPDLHLVEDIAGPIGIVEDLDPAKIYTEEYNRLNTDEFLKALVETEEDLSAWISGEMRDAHLAVKVPILFPIDTHRVDQASKRSAALSVIGGAQTYLESKERTVEKIRGGFHYLLDEKTTFSITLDQRTLTASLLDSEGITLYEIEYQTSREMAQTQNPSPTQLITMLQTCYVRDTSPYFEIFPLSSETESGDVFDSSYNRPNGKKKSVHGINMYGDTELTKTNLLDLLACQFSVFIVENINRDRYLSVEFDTGKGTVAVIIEAPSWYIDGIRSERPDVLPLSFYVENYLMSAIVRKDQVEMGYEVQKGTGVLFRKIYETHCKMSVLPACKQVIGRTEEDVNAALDAVFRVLSGETQTEPRATATTITNPELNASLEIIPSGNLTELRTAEGEQYDSVHLREITYFGGQTAMEKVRDIVASLTQKDVVVPRELMALLVN